MSLRMNLFLTFRKYFGLDINIYNLINILYKLY